MLVAIPVTARVQRVQVSIQVLLENVRRHIMLRLYNGRNHVRVRRNAQRLMIIAVDLLLQAPRSEGDAHFLLTLRAEARLVMGRLVEHLLRVERLSLSVRVGGEVVPSLNGLLVLSGSRPGGLHVAKAVSSSHVFTLAYVYLLL